MRKFNFLILSIIIISSGSPQLVSAEPNISPEIEDMFHILRLDLATQYVGSLVCDISIHYPDTSLAEKEKIMSQMIEENNAEEIIAEYYNTTKIEMRQKIFKDYIDNNCSVDFLESNWEN